VSLSLLGCVVKATLHSATEEWLLDNGEPREMIDEVRARRETLAAQAVARADTLAASRLDVDDEQDALGEVPALPMPSAARVTHASEGDGDLMEWMHQQREAKVSWAEIALAAALKGCQSSEDALRSRYKRWREKHAQADSGSTTE
jgi:G3E family GTPase